MRAFCNEVAQGLDGLGKAPVGVELPDVLQRIRSLVSAPHDHGEQDPEGEQ
jgi:hypothetical protein